MVEEHEEQWNEDGLPWGEEILEDPNFLTNQQAAEYLGLTFNSFKTIANRATEAGCPLRYVKARVNGRSTKYFRKSWLDEWEIERKLRNTRNWPPTRSQLVQRTSHQIMPKPNAKHFPDNGEAIPSYINLAGRRIKPGWVTCLFPKCDVRFLSPDKTRVRYCDTCANSLDDRVLNIF